MTNSSIKIVFLTSSSPQEKIRKLIQTANQHLIEKKFLYILTQSPDVTNFVDNLLWQYPKEGFIPHTTQFIKPHYIFINSDNSFPPQIYSFFNLTTAPMHPPATSCKIFEFDESNMRDKKEIFEKKYKFYQDCGYHLISL